jgi:hypothetical protein
MSYRRAGIEELGAFRLGYGCDEADFCIRVHHRRPEKVLLYDPEADVKHQVPAARGRWKHLASRCFFEGRSKAVVSRLVGIDAGLASERRHALRMLPSGVAHAVADVIDRGAASGLARAGGDHDRPRDHVDGLRLREARRRRLRGGAPLRRSGSAGVSGRVKPCSALDAAPTTSRAGVDA